MTEILSTLLSYLYWVAIIGGVGWWIWSMRRSSTPPKRSAADSAELARIRAALEDLDSPLSLGRSDRAGAQAVTPSCQHGQDAAVTGARSTVN